MYSGCWQSFLSESLTFSPTALALVVGFEWWRNGGGRCSHPEKGRCWASSFPEALASLYTSDLKCRCRISDNLGGFYSCEPKRKNISKGKRSGPALNSCPSMPETQWREIWHWLASPLWVSQHLHSKSVSLSTRVCSVVSGQENLSVIELSLSRIISY